MPSKRERSDWHNGTVTNAYGGTPWVTIRPNVVNRWGFSSRNHELGSGRIVMGDKRRGTPTLTAQALGGRTASTCDEIQDDWS